MKKIICITLSIIFVFALIGCKSSKNDNKVSKSKNSTKIETPKINVIKKDVSTATYDQYLQVTVGDNYDKAVSVLGKPNKEIESDGNKTYVWEGENGKTISLVVTGDSITSKSESLLGNNNANVTIDQFNQLKEGMTLEQTQAILGTGVMTYEEKTVDYDRVMYSYYNANGSNINLNFRNGTLYSMSKNNIG